METPKSVTVDMKVDGTCLATFNSPKRPKNAKDKSGLGLGDDNIWTKHAIFCLLVVTVRFRIDIMLYMDI